MGRFWLCQCIRSSPVLSSLGTEFWVSAIFSSVNILPARTSYMASYLLWCTQCSCGNHWKKTDNLCANRETDNVLRSSVMSCAWASDARAALLTPLFLSTTPLWWRLLAHNKLGKKVWYNICQLPFSKKLDSINIDSLPKKNTAITLSHIPVLPNTVLSFYCQV